MDSETKNFFEEVKTGERWVILSDAHQQLPVSLRVVGAETRKTQEKKDMKVLLLKDAEGAQFVVSAWSRDVAACINEWGTDPMAWGVVTFRYDASRGRWRLQPLEPQPQPTEERIGA